MPTPPDGASNHSHKSAESLPETPKTLISFYVAVIVLICASLLVVYHEKVSSSAAPIREAATIVPSSTQHTAIAPQTATQSTNSANDDIINPEPLPESSIAIRNDPAELWRRVQRGSANAEVELARLYLDGQRVTQNCEQARMLLLAASRKRSGAAIDLLSGAYVHRCR